MDDAVEVTLTSWIPKSNGERRLTFVVQRDDAHKVDAMRNMVGHSFGMALAKIDYDNPQQPQQRRNRTSDSTTTVGELPAPSEGVAPDLSAEVESAIETHNKQIALKYLKICQVRRNDPAFRGFMFDYFKKPLLLNPVLAREWVRQKQHELLGVDSCAKIYPGSHAEQMLLWLESAFSADGRNLPIPLPPPAVIQRRVDETNEASK